VSLPIHGGLLTTFPNAMEHPEEKFPTWDGSTHACSKYPALLAASIGYPQRAKVTKVSIPLILNRLSVTGHCVRTRAPQGFSKSEFAENLLRGIIIVKRQTFSLSFPVTKGLCTYV
jgi:hypothetical protein